MNKIVSSILLLIVVIVLINNISLASGGPIVNPNAININTGYYKPTIQGANSNGKFLNMSNNAIAAVSTVGTAVSIIVLIIIGIKYALGSIEEKAHYKETLKPYLIGSFMIFGIFTILKVVQVVTEYVL